MAKKALLGEDLTIFGAGDYIRDYIYVEDVARGFLIAGAKVDAINGGHFVLATGVGTAFKDAVRTVADLAFERTGKKVAVHHEAWPQHLSLIEQRHFVGDSTRFREGTGWDPRVSFEEGIRRTIDVFMEGMSS